MSVKNFIFKLRIITAILNVDKILSKSIDSIKIVRLGELFCKLLLELIFFIVLISSSFSLFSLLLLLLTTFSFCFK